MPDKEIPIKIVDGVPKIYPFEKHYITLALKELIEKAEKDYLEEQESVRTAPEGSRLRDSLLGALPLVKSYINDLKITLERVENLEEVE